MASVATRTGIRAGGALTLRRWLALSFILVLLTPASMPDLAAAQAGYGQFAPGRESSARSAASQSTDGIIRSAYDAAAALSRDLSADERKGTFDPAAPARPLRHPLPDGRTALEEQALRGPAAPSAAFAQARAPPRDAA